MSYILAVLRYFFIVWLSNFLFGFKPALIVFVSLLVPYLIYVVMPWREKQQVLGRGLQHFEVVFFGVVLWFFAILILPDIVKKLIVSIHRDFWVSIDVGFRSNVIQPLMLFGATFLVGILVRLWGDRVSGGKSFFVYNGLVFLIGFTLYYPFLLLFAAFAPMDKFWILLSVLIIPMLLGTFAPDVWSFGKKLFSKRS